MKDIVRLVIIEVIIVYEEKFREFWIFDFLV